MNQEYVQYKAEEILLQLQTHTVAVAWLSDGTRYYAMTRPCATCLAIYEHRLTDRCVALCLTVSCRVERAIWLLCSHDICLLL